MLLDSDCDFYCKPGANRSTCVTPRRKRLPLRTRSGTVCSSNTNTLKYLDYKPVSYPQGSYTMVGLQPTLAHRMVGRRPVMRRERDPDRDSSTAAREGTRTPEKHVCPGHRPGHARCRCLWLTRTPSKCTDLHKQTLGGMHRMTSQVRRPQVLPDHTTSSLRPASWSTPIGMRR